MTENNNELLTLFNEKSDVDNLKEILDIDTGKVPLGMTKFQIENFVLNKREFPTDLMKFQQAKMEIYTRIQSFADMYYQYREAKAKIKLAEGRIEDLKNNSPNLNIKIKDAKIELQEIEIEKNQYSLKSIQHTAKEKLKEAAIFYKTYSEFRNFELLNTEELAKLEEEGWRIKSQYYPELQQRYCLTPQGFISLPHEQDRLKVLTERTNNLQRQPFIEKYKGGGDIQ